MPAKRLEISEDMTPFAKRLVGICIERDISLKKLSETAADLPKTTIYEIVDKKREPTLPTIRKILVALNMTYVDFFVGMDDNLEEEFGNPLRIEAIQLQKDLNAEQSDRVLTYVKNIAGLAK